MSVHSTQMVRVPRFAGSPPPATERPERSIMNEPDARVFSADRHRQGPPRLTFDDLLDVVNPVHHLPLVGTAYRELTGDGITGHARILGGTLYGGPLGMASATANVVIEDATGRDVVGNAFVAFRGDAPPQSTVVAYAGQGRPATVDDAASSAPAPDIQRQSVALRQPSTEPGPFMQAYLAGRDGSGTAGTIATAAVPTADQAGASIDGPVQASLDLAPRPGVRPPAAQADTVSPSREAGQPAVAPHPGAAMAIDGRLDAALTALAAASANGGEDQVGTDEAAWREREEAARRALERRSATLDVSPASSPPAHGHNAYASAGSLSLGPAISAGT